VKQRYIQFIFQNFLYYNKILSSICASSFLFKSVLDMNFVILLKKINVYRFLPKNKSYAFDKYWLVCALWFLNWWIIHWGKCSTTYLVLYWHNISGLMNYVRHKLFHEEGVWHLKNDPTMKSITNHNDPFQTIITH
jgi:hypothetical protein